MDYFCKICEVEKCKVLGLPEVGENGEYESWMSSFLTDRFKWKLERCNVPYVTIPENKYADLRGEKAKG